MIENELMNNKKPDQNKYWIKYINFRRKIISNYNTFIEALFKESDYFSFDTPVAIIRAFILMDQDSQRVQLSLQ